MTNNNAETQKPKKKRERKYEPMNYIFKVRTPDGRVRNFDEIPEDELHAIKEKLADKFARALGYEPETTIYY